MLNWGRSNWRKPTHGTKTRQAQSSNLRPAPSAPQASQEPASSDAQGPRQTVAALPVPQQKVSLARDNPSGGSSNEVNRLVVLNRSNKSLYLMPDEIIVGSSQGRTIGRELVIRPSPKPFPIDVFCVGSDRWSHRGEATPQAFLAAAGGNQRLSASVAVQGDNPEQSRRRCSARYGPSCSRATPCMQPTPPPVRAPAGFAAAVRPATSWPRRIRATSRSAKPTTLWRLRGGRRSGSCRSRRRTRRRFPVTVGGVHASAFAKYPGGEPA